MFSFDSILVRLKGGAVSHTHLFLCFDSILVRLKASISDSACVNVTVFRFHTGSIKSLARETQQIQTELVSIPYWFD